MTVRFSHASHEIDPHWAMVAALALVNFFLLLFV
jgi:hypothetical protein